MAKRKKRTYPKKGTEKYNVLDKITLGIDKSKIEYLRGEIIYLKPSEAQQFINEQKIKR